MFANIANLLDLITTWVALNYCDAREANPIIAWLIGIDWSLAVIFKLGIVALFSWFALTRYKDRATWPVYIMGAVFLLFAILNTSLLWNN